MTGVLIGRDHPAGILRAEIGRAVDSHGGLVLVTGEAGIGKTALVTGAADDARRLGALVLSGSCWDSDSAPGYWPWVQVIRALRRGVSAEERAEAEAAAGNGLSVLLGESPGGEPADGFALYDAVTTALVSVSHSRPVVVILDDLHWADTASLKLLEFAAQHTWFERLLLIGTYRDVEVEAVDHPLQPLILPLLARATTVTLTGLGRDEVGALMAATVGREPEPELITEVFRRTGGNPFFVEQTARLWHSGGSVTAVAPGVRDAVRRRLSLLPKPVVGMLTTAAVLGREFHRQVLAAASSAPVPQVDRMLDEAVAARLVLSNGGGRFSFAHDLVRETLYDALDKGEARRQHAAVVAAIDRSPALADRVVPGDLANHAFLAGEELEPTRAVDLLVAAAEDAGNRLASEEAAGHYGRAFQLAAGVNPRRRITIALDLARTLHHSGNPEQAWQIFQEAIALARELDDAELLARVALTMHGRMDDAGERRDLTAELLTEAYRGLAGEEPEAGISINRLAQDLAVRVTVLARRDDDDEALGFSLWARHDAIWGPGTAAEREALTAELVAVARRTDDPGMEFFASSFRWVALLELGDPRFLDQFAEFQKVAQRQSKPLPTMGRYIDRIVIATLSGSFAEAEELLDTLVTMFDDHTHPYFTRMMLHMRWAVLLPQGRYAELDELHRALAESNHPYSRLLAAITAVQRGDLDAGLRHLAETTARGTPVSRIFNALWLRFQAQIAAAARDAELCERVRAELAPFASEWAVSLYGCDVSGPMSLWLALLDAAQERWDDAIAGFTAAHESAERLRARPWSVEARSRLAAALLGSGRPAAAAALLDEVERDATELGMPHVLDRLRRTRSTMDSADAPPANEFRFTGEVWTLTMGGRTVHLPDAKGLRDLHELLGRPGVDIPAVELLNPEGGQLVIAARRLGGDAVLDEDAKIAYKRRLATLDEEIDRATERGDDRRAVELDRERATLLDELRAAAGLAGRTRRLGDETERARKTVTARIRDTLRKLDERHPEVAAHLRATVTTGVTCRYQPDPGTTWRL